MRLDAARAGHFLFLDGTHFFALLEAPFWLAERHLVDTGRLGTRFGTRLGALFLIEGVLALEGARGQ